MADEKNKSWFARHKILTTILGVIAFFVIVGALAPKSETNTSNNSKESATSKPEKAAGKTTGLNQPASDGKFEFTVKAIECGITSAGTNQYMTKAPQGQFCKLTLAVKNIGSEPQSLFSANQKLEANGNKYAADDVATMYAAPDASSTWYSNINPGNSVEGAIFFDLPVGVTPTTAELHDSAYSGGVKVNLQ